MFWSHFSKVRSEVHQGILSQRISELCTREAQTSPERLQGCRIHRTKRSWCPEEAQGLWEGHQRRGLPQGDRVRADVRAAHRPWILPCWGLVHRTSLRDQSRHQGTYRVRGLRLADVRALQRPETPSQEIRHSDLTSCDQVLHLAVIPPDPLPASPRPLRQQQWRSRQLHSLRRHTRPVLRPPQHLLPGRKTLAHQLLPLQRRLCRSWLLLLRDCLPPSAVEAMLSCVITHATRKPRDQVRHIRLYSLNTVSLSICLSVV